MEKLNQKKGNTEIKSENENSIKITIARKTADGLTELMQRVNDGFSAGRVCRQDIASWIIAKFLGNYSDSDLQQIREAHYDEASMLDVINRKAKETGEIPEFLRDAMRKHFRSLTDGPKKVKRTLTSEYINDVHSKNEDAA